MRRCGEWCEEDAIVKIMSAANRGDPFPEIRISEHDFSCLLICRRNKLADMRVVWVRNCYIDAKCGLLKRSALSGTWYFPTYVVFFNGNLDTDTKYSTNRTVQQMVLLLGICIEYF